MNRNSTVDALVLSVKPAAGENNRLASVLSPDKGIFNAVVYGGRKGRLKSLVSPYHSGKMWLYSDAVKHSVKITDFNPEHYRSGIRDNIYKACAAALCAELILKTQGAADTSSVWILANGFWTVCTCAAKKKRARVSCAFCGATSALWACRTIYARAGIAARIRPRGIRPTKTPLYVRTACRRTKRMSKIIGNRFFR